MNATENSRIEVDGRELTLSNLGKALPDYDTVNACSVPASQVSLATRWIQSGTFAAGASAAGAQPSQIRHTRDQQDHREEPANHHKNRIEAEHQLWIAPTRQPKPDRPLAQG